MDTALNGGASGAHIFQEDAARQAMRQLDAIRERLFATYETLRVERQLPGVIGGARVLGPDFENAIATAVDHFTFNQRLFVWSYANPKALREEGRLAGRRQNADNVGHLLRFCFSDCCGHVLSPHIAPLDNAVTKEDTEAALRRSMVLNSAIRDVAHNYKILLSAVLDRHEGLKTALDEFQAAAIEMQSSIILLGATLGKTNDALAYLSSDVTDTKLNQAETIGHLLPVNERLFRFPN